MKNPGQKQLFVTKCKQQEAVKLISDYCSLMPRQYRYAWSKKEQDRWKHESASERQIHSIQSKYSKYEISGNAENLSKLDASRMIDLSKQLSEKRRKIKEYNTNRTNKQKKENLYKEKKKSEKENLKNAEKKFIFFKNCIKKSITELNANKKKKKQQVEEFQQECIEKTTVFPVELYSVQKKVPSEKQELYMNRLIAEAKKIGIKLDERFSLSGRNSVECSILISLMTHLISSNLKEKEEIKYLANDLENLMLQGMALSPGFHILSIPYL